MGYGNYSYQAHQAIISERKKAPLERVFAQRGCHPLMDPKGLRYREARDSDAHPISLPITFALDVTGSMGTIPERLARRDMPRFMQTLREVGVLEPQVLFVGIGDANSDGAPLQVGQFESEAAAMDGWLTRLYLEAGGGGQGAESYELAMYLLSRHIYMDHWVKRKRRGYLFITGDELPYPWVSRHQVRELIADELEADIRVQDVVQELQISFEPFFLIPGVERLRSCERGWRDLLGDHTIALDSFEDTAPVSAALLALTEGIWESVDQLVEYHKQAGTSGEQVGRIVRAVTPYAASIGRSGGPVPKLEPAGIA